MLGERDRETRWGGREGTCCSLIPKSRIRREGGRFLKTHFGPPPLKWIREDGNSFNSSEKVEGSLRVVRKGGIVKR